MKKKIIFFFIFLFLLLFLYHGISKVYFQQDEWYTIGKTIWYLNGHFTEIFTKHFALHYVPFASIYFLIEYLLFGINAQLYLYAGIALEAIAGVALVLFFKKFFKPFTSFLLVILFLTNGGIYQILLNEMVSYYTISLIFAILFLSEIYNCLFAKNLPSLKKLIFLFLLFICAVLFNEAWLSLALILPVFILIFKKFPFTRYYHNKKIYIFLTLIAVTILTRVALEKVLPADSPRPIPESFKVSAFYNLVTMPIKLPVQYIFGFPVIINLATFYEKHISYFRNDALLSPDLVAVTLGYDTLVFYIGSILGIIATATIICGRKISDLKRYRALLTFGITWILGISILLSFQGRFLITPEPRYLYLSSVGILIVMGSFFEIFWEKLQENVFLKRIMFFVFFILFVTWGLYSYLQIQQQVSSVVTVSIVRKSIMLQTKAEVPVLPKKAIFYVFCSDNCSGNSALGMPNTWIVPFQNGFGWNLLVLYSQKDPGRFAQFFQNSFLWDIDKEGYKEIGEYGFGYFTNEKKLKNVSKKYHLTKDNIVSLQYNSQKHTILRVGSNKLF